MECIFVIPNDKDNEVNKKTITNPITLNIIHYPKSYIPGLANEVYQTKPNQSQLDISLAAGT